MARVAITTIVATRDAGTALARAASWAGKQGPTAQWDPIAYCDAVADVSGALEALAYVERAMARRGRSDARATRRVECIADLSRAMERLREATTG